MKALVKIFSYNKLVEEAEKQGWEIPTLEELREAREEILKKDDFEVDWVWTSDEITDEKVIADMEEDGYAPFNESHMIAYHPGSDEYGYINKNTMIKVLVNKLPCEWREDSNDYGLYHTSCENMYQVIEATPSENGFIFCPFCGKTLKEI